LGVADVEVEDLVGPRVGAQSASRAGDSIGPRPGLGPRLWSRAEVGWGGVAFEPFGLNFNPPPSSPKVRSPHSR